MSFLAKFFSRTASRSFEQFINLRQAERSMDEYSKKSICLSRFEPYMRANEVYHAYCFQHGLRRDILKYMVTS